MGGRVGLKGTDRVVEEALRRGAMPISPARASRFLSKLKDLGLEEELRIVTCPALMGQEEAEAAGLQAEILPYAPKERTTGEDTRELVKKMAKKVDIIVFVGGDGTARDILEGLKGAEQLPVLGVPSGVKMYSGIFAVNPDNAAQLLEAFIGGQAEVTELEIVDVDENAIRSDRLAIRLYGHLKGPFIPSFIQGSKQLTQDTTEESEVQQGIARFIVEEMDSQGTYILGPGTTVKHVADLLKFQKTLLGIDIYQQGHVITDANEETIRQTVQDWTRTWIIVSPIGRQGILFGRGNQQISPEILREMRRDHILVLATPSKMKSIEEEILRIDTGDREVDNKLRGYIRIATDYREWRLARIDSET